MMILLWATRATTGGFALLFLFVAVLPHRYLKLGADAAGLEQALAWFPAGLSLVLVALVRTSGARFRVIPTFWPATAWLVAMMLGSLGSEVPRLGLLATGYYAATGLLLSWALVSLRSHDSVYRWILVTGVAASAGVGVYGIYEFVSGTNPWYEDAFSLLNPRYARFATDAFGRRILATVGHPVYLGTYFATLFPIALHFTLTSDGQRRLAAAIGSGLLLGGLLLTFTRGAYAAAFTAAIYYLARRGVRRGLKVAAVTGAIAVIALSSNRVWETLAGRDTIAQLQRFRTDQRGVAYWQSSGLLLEAPLLGIGTGHYRYLADRHRDYNDTPDNMHLRLLAETGLAGYAAFVLLMVSVLVHLRQAERRLPDPRDRDLARAITASVVGFLVDMLTCDALYFPLTRITFWIIVGCGLSLWQLASREGEDQTAPEVLRV